MRQIGPRRDFEREIPERGGQKPTAGKKRPKNAPKRDAKQRGGPSIVEVPIRTEIPTDDSHCLEGAR